MGEPQPKYVVDTASFTQVRRVYPLDVFPGVWEKLDACVDSGLLVSSDLVLDELKAQDDEILAWAKKHSSIFLPLDESIQQKAKEILRTHTALYDHKKKKSGADPFVIATAIQLSCGVVTEEDKSGGPNKFKIPDVCEAYGVECMKVLEMLRREGVRL